MRWQPASRIAHEFLAFQSRAACARAIKREETRAEQVIGQSAYRFPPPTIIGRADARRFISITPTRRRARRPLFLDWRCRHGLRSTRQVISPAKAPLDDITLLLVEISPRHDDYAGRRRALVMRLLAHRHFTYTPRTFISNSHDDARLTRRYAMRRATLSRISYRAPTPSALLFRIIAMKFLSHDTRHKAGARDERRRHYLVAE